MQTIVSLYNRLQSVNTDAIIEDSIEQTKDDIAETNKEQMFAGLNNQGVAIGEYQSDLYAQVKNRINPLPGYGVPDLKNTGAFYEGIVTNVIGDSIITDSTDSKSPELRRRYSEKIFGLGGTFKTDFLNNNLRPAIKQRIEQATGLQMK